MRFILIAATLGLTLRASAADEMPAVDPVEQAWTDATLYLFKEAFRGFDAAEGREARLGRAALLLLQQPKTDGNLNEAERELTALLNAEPADDISASARYLLGRLAQIHRADPDLAAAAAHFRALIAEQSGHLLADQALIKLALIELHDASLGAEERRARFDAYAARVEDLARPSSRRDLALTLAAIGQHYRLGDERLLRLHLTAEQAGIQSPTTKANTLVSIGELAARLGQADLARDYFERFLAEFHRDYRRALVRDKLAALPATSSASQSPQARQ